MMTTRLLNAMFFMLSLLLLCDRTACFGAEEEEEKKQVTADVAIFVKNRAGKELAGKLKSFEDMVVGSVTEHGFRVISREDAVQALDSFAGKKGKDELDALLENNTSALRLAQKLQADYLIVAALSSLGKETKHLRYRDIDRVITVNRLRVAYKVLDGIKGSSISAGTVTAEKRIQQSDTLQTKNTDLLNGLLADAAEQIGSKLKADGGAEAIVEAADKPEMVEFAVTCGMQDLSIPAVTRSEDSEEYVLTGNRYKLETLHVDVSLDGAVIGTAPGQFKAYPGLHKMRLTRPGFKTWERTVNITGNGQVLNIPLQLSEAGMKRWRENTSFLNNLKRQRQLDDAEIEKLRGIAEMLRQSGYRIDIQGAPDQANIYSDVQIDGTDPARN